jgi:hypothetical protein
VPFATLMILLIVAVLVMAGVLIMAGALKPPRQQHVCRADGCGHKNAPEALYCARCGAKLVGRRGPDRAPRA